MEDVTIAQILSQIDEILFDLDQLRLLIEEV